MSLQDKYNEWRQTRHGREIYPLVRDRALQLRRLGFKHYSVEALFNVIRWHRHIQHGPDAEGFKINCHHKPYMARELMMNEPELDGFFETRRLHCER